MYWCRCGYVVIVRGCSGWVWFSIGADVFAMCWYSGCSFMVFGIKYVMARCLCVAGCVRKRSGIGPGFSSMSPHLSRSSLLM
jgi:hypothetical protein